VWGLLHAMGRGILIHSLDALLFIKAQFFLHSLGVPHALNLWVSYYYCSFVTSNPLRRHLKAKRKAPAYSQALRRIISVDKMRSKPCYHLARLVLIKIESCHSEAKRSKKIFLHYRSEQFGSD